MENLLSIDETAQKLKSHPETVRRFIRQGQLAGVKLGRSWRVRESDLTAFISPRVIPARSEASTPANGGGNPLAAALALSDKLTPEIASGASGGTFNAADELNTMREERDRDLSGV